MLIRKQCSTRLRMELTSLMVVFRAFICCTSLILDLFVLHAVEHDFVGTQAPE